MDKETHATPPAPPRDFVLTANCSCLLSTVSSSLRRSALLPKLNFGRNQFLPILECDFSQ